MFGANMRVYKGKIKGAGAHYILIEDAETAVLRHVKCDAAMLPALESTFTSDIFDDGYIGEEIFWVLDEDSETMLAGFVPVRMASGEIFISYARQLRALKKAA